MSGNTAPINYGFNPNNLYNPAQANMGGGNFGSVNYGDSDWMQNFSLSPPPATDQILQVDFPSSPIQETGGSLWDNMFGGSRVGPNGEVLQNANYFGSAVGGIGALASIYTGLEGLNLAKNQYSTNKSLINRNLSNQAASINNEIDNVSRSRYNQNAAGKGQELSLEEYQAAERRRVGIDGSAL